MITMGQARRIATELRGEGLAQFSTTGTVTAYARMVVEGIKTYDVRGSYRDPQGVMADARALAEYMDANVGVIDPEGWKGAWDTTVVPWSYRP